jgi:hypothetical protein
MPSGPPLGNQNARKKRKPTNPQGNPNIAQYAGNGKAGAPQGNANGFVHGLSLIKKKRIEKRLPRGKDKRFKLELLNELIQDAGGPKEITATRRLQAEIVATDATWLNQMDRAIQRVLRLVPTYRENAAALAKLDSYRRPVINSLSANLDRFGFTRVPPRTKTREEILNQPDENEGQDDHVQQQSGGK